jgi:hypothetical protein
MPGVPDHNPHQTKAIPLNIPCALPFTKVVPRWDFAWFSFSIIVNAVAALTAVAVNHQDSRLVAG